MDKKIIINILASRKGMEIFDNEEDYRMMPLIEFDGVQPTGSRENLYDKRAKMDIINAIFYMMTSETAMNDDEKDELWNELNKKIDTNIYRMLKYYDTATHTFFNENKNCNKYVEIMLKKREKMPDETNKQYKQRVKQEEAEELEQAGILINYDLRGIFSSKMPLLTKFKIIIDSIKNKHISSMEIGSFVRGENPIPDEEENYESEEELTIEPEEDEQEFKTPISTPENTDIDTPEMEPIEDEEEFETPISAPENTDIDTPEMEPIEDEEEFETPISATENTDTDTPEMEPVEDEEEFETPISIPENTDIETPEKESAEDEEEFEKTVSESKKTDSDVTKIENKLNSDEKNDYKKSLAYLMGKRTGKIIRTAKSTLRKTSEQLNNYTKKEKSELEDKSQDVTVELNKVKANAKKKISGLAQEGKKQVGRTYTSTKETFEKMKAKAQDSEFRKKVAKKIAVAGLMGVMVAGTLTAMPKAGTINVDHENKQEKEPSSVVFIEEDSEDKDEITIEDKQETPTVEKKDIELKDTLTESIEDNVGIGTKVILTQGKYYADPNGTGKSYDLENFTTKYGNEFEITRINIVTAEGKNVQINLKNGDGMTYSKIKENYPGCEIVAAHLASGNMQVGWTNIDMTHAILNNLKLSTNAQKTILDNEDGKISESERMEIEKAVSKALENMQENQKGEER